MSGSRSGSGIAAVVEKMVRRIARRLLSVQAPAVSTHAARIAEWKVSRD
jgi:hypothetical protein